MTLLRRYRLANGLGQGVLARRLGVTTAAYSSWETGRTKPRPKHYPKLAPMLGLTPMELTKIIVPDHAGASAS